MRTVVFAVSLGLAAVAHADTAAVFAKPGTKFAMTVKIASNGDWLGKVPGRTGYYLNDKDYFVDQTPTGVVVIKLDDVVKVMAEQPASREPRLTTAAQRPVNRDSTVNDKALRSRDDASGQDHQREDPRFNWECRRIQDQQ